MWIEGGGHLQEWRQQFVFFCFSVVLPPKVLDSARPVNVSSQSAVAQTEPVNGPGRVEIKNLVGGGGGLEPIDFVQQRRGYEQTPAENNCGSNPDSLARGHFKFRRSKIRMAAQRAMVA